MTLETRRFSSRFLAYVVVSWLLIACRIDDTGRERFQIRYEQLAGVAPLIRFACSSTPLDRRPSSNGEHRSPPAVNHQLAPPIISSPPASAAASDASELVVVVVVANTNYKRFVDNFRSFLLYLAADVMHRLSSTAASFNIMFYRFIFLEF